MKKWRTLYTHSRQLPNSSSVIRKNICHHDHDYHAHNHHMNQSMTLQNVGSLYSKFREFGEDQDAVSFNQNIHRKNRMVLFCCIQRGRVPLPTLWFSWYTFEIWDEMEFKKMVVTLCVLDRSEWAYTHFQDEILGFPFLFDLCSSDE